MIKIKITLLLLACTLVACDKHYRAGDKELPLEKNAYYFSKDHPHKPKTKEEKKKSNREKIDQDMQNNSNPNTEKSQ
jgi:hypothetical protein